MLAPLAAWVLRRPLSSWWPFLAVLAAELVNEIFDATRYLRAGWPWQGWKTLGQIGLTMVVPALYMAVARWRGRGSTQDIA